MVVVSCSDGRKVKVGRSVWILVGTSVENSEGEMLGMGVGHRLNRIAGFLRPMGKLEGNNVGFEREKKTLGLALGDDVGTELGVIVGADVGDTLGIALGVALGDDVGIELGVIVVFTFTVAGCCVGSVDCPLFGNNDWNDVGAEVGRSLGETDGNGMSTNEFSSLPRGKNTASILP